MIEIIKKLGHRISSGVVGGFVAGFLVGGVGGRLAMLLLRLTSGPSIIGLQSDDDFTMGTMSGATIFLVSITTMGGALLGAVYSVFREVLPEARRAQLTALFFGLVGGAAIVRPGGVDFTLVKPQVLAIFLFILLPALYGYLMSRLVDRLLARPAGKVLPWLGLALLVVPLFAVGTDVGPGILIGIVAVIALAVFAVVKLPKLRTLAGHPAVVWIGRVAMLAAAAYGAIDLVSDAVEIL